MLRMFTKPLITQAHRKVSCLVINARNIKTYVVNEKLSRINAAMMDDEPGDYETAMLRAFGFLRSSEPCLEPALHSIEIALKFNPNSLCAYMLKSLLCNELGLNEQGKDCVRRLQSNIPNYLDDIFQIDKSLAEAIKISPVEPTKENAQAHKATSSGVKTSLSLLEKLPSSSDDYSNFYTMPAYK